MSAGPAYVPALARVAEAMRRPSGTLTLEGDGIPAARTLITCDGCGEVASAGVDEAAARLNLLATGGAVVNGLDYCPACDGDEVDDRVLR